MTTRYTHPLFIQKKVLFLLVYQLSSLVAQCTMNLNDCNYLIHARRIKYWKIQYCYTLYHIFRLPYKFDIRGTFTTVPFTVITLPLVLFSNLLLLLPLYPLFGNDAHCFYLIQQLSDLNRLGRILFLSIL